MTLKTNGKLSQKFYLKPIAKKNTIQNIIVNGNIIKNDQSVANELKKFSLTNIGPNLANNINANNKRTYTSYLTKVTASNFYFSPTSQDDQWRIQSWS